MKTKLFTLRTATGKSRAIVIGEIAQKHGVIIPITKLTAYEKNGDMPFSVAVIFAKYYNVDVQDVVDLQVAD